GAIGCRLQDDQEDRLPAWAADVVSRSVALIVGNTVSVMQAAKAAGATMPLVFVTGADPVRTGLVTSLNRPAGNITGVTFTTTDLAAKQLGLLHELVPNATVIAVLHDPGMPDSQAELHSLEAAGRAIGRQILTIKAGNEHELRAGFAMMHQAGAGAVLIRGGPFFLSQRRQLVALAARYALPAGYVTRDYPEAGGLMSYGTSQTDAYRRA